MKIISHRGCWLERVEQNSRLSFDRSFEQGFGTETDVRDCQGKLVISHDPPNGNEITLAALLEIHSHYPVDLPLALNIKADGLQAAIKIEISRYSKLDYFCFDMAVPDALIYNRYDLKFFTRQSEIEPDPILYKESCGVWVDMFYSDWVKEEDVLRHLDAGKRVCLVSPDLHKRSHKLFWKQILDWTSVCSPDILICTDYPAEAQTFFFGERES